MFFVPSIDQTCMWWISRTPATLASMSRGDAVAVEAVGHAFEQHMRGLAHQRPGGGEDEHGDEHRQDRVDRRPAGRTG